MRRAQPTRAPARAVPTWSSSVNKKGLGNTLQPPTASHCRADGSGISAHVRTASTFEKEAGCLPLRGPEGWTRASGWVCAWPEPFGKPLLWSDTAVT